MRSAKDRRNTNVAVQQHTKTAAHLDQLGEQARNLRQEMADATDAVAETREELKGYNERRREQTAELKTILTPIVRHLQAGGTANGVTGLHNWAAWYNPTAKGGKNAARQIMRIVNSREPGEKQGDIKSPKAPKVKEGQTITFFDFLDENDQRIKVTFKITALPAGISELWGDKNDRTKRFGTIGIELVEAPKKKEPKEPRKQQPIMHIHDERSALTLCEVFYSRKHGISKYYKKAGVANCKKCIAIANEKGLPTTLTKAEVTPVKKISHKETAEAIEKVLSQFPRTRDEFIAAGCTDPDNGNACQWNLRFYEWKRTGTAKQPFCLEVNDGELFAFAGLWDGWKNADGQWTKTCTILTTTPNAVTSTVHDRMPVILDRECYELWLDPGMQNVAAVSELLKPYDARMMHAYPVSPRINHVANDDQECSRAVEHADIQSGLFS